MVSGAGGGGGPCPLRGCWGIGCCSLSSQDAKAIVIAINKKMGLIISMFFIVAL